jgi:hypothetical protein
MRVAVSECCHIVIMSMDIGTERCMGPYDAPYTRSRGYKQPSSIRDHLITQPSDDYSKAKPHFLLSALKSQGAYAHNIT